MSETPLTDAICASKEVTHFGAEHAFIAVKEHARRIETRLHSRDTELAKANQRIEAYNRNKSVVAALSYADKCKIAALEAELAKAYACIRDIARADSLTQVAYAIHDHRPVIGRAIDADTIRKAGDAV